MSNRIRNLQIFVVASLMVGCSQLPLDIEVVDDAGPLPGTAGQSQGGSSVLFTGGQSGMFQDGGQAGIGVVTGGAGGSITTMGGSGGSPPPDCAATAIRCSPVSPNVAESCVLGKWTFQTDCNAFACNMGKCNVCIPNSVICSVSQKTKISCSTDGQKETVLVCQYGCTADGTDCRDCPTDGAIDCPSASSIRTCVAGKWNPISNCAANQVCSSAGCSCPVGKGSLDGQCLDLMGYSSSFNYTASVSPGFIWTIKITLTRPGTLRGLGVLGQRTGPRTRMALYKDGAGAPSSLITESPAAGIVAGPNHYKTIASPLLAAGDYWIGATVESSANILQEAIGNKVLTYQAPQGFSTSMAPTMAGSSNFMGYPFNFFVLVE